MEGKGKEGEGSEGGGDGWREGEEGEGSEGGGDGWMEGDATLYKNSFIPMVIQSHWLALTVMY